MRAALISIAALTLAACSTPPAPPPPPPAEKPAPAVARFDGLSYEGRDAVFDQIKTGPMDYLNPILPGYYPDPSIERVGDDYYLVNSSFTHFPGLPVWHSKDMVHWTQIANAVDRPSQADFGKLEVSRGLFAPAISYHDGTYYIINTCVDCVEDTKENFIITGTNPAGPWSEPITLNFEGIDPSIYFENGKAYIVNNGPPDGAPLYNGHRAIWMQEYDIAAQKMVGPRKVVVNGGADIKTKPIWVEGPHLYHINGWYYLICAEGGTSEYHAEVIFRSKKLWGPYESYKGNPILTQRDLPEGRTFPVTSTGHADLVQTQKGQWYAVFLGTRPYQDKFYNTGRETFMLPVTWKNGWPIILKKSEAVPFTVKRPNLPQEAGPQPHAGNFAFNDTFDKPLGLEWVMIRTPHEKWYSVEGGELNVKARPVAIGDNANPSFIARRQQHANAVVTTTMRFDPKIDGERAGLVAFQSSNAFYFLGAVREGGAVKVCVTKRGGAAEPAQGSVVACAPAPQGALNLKVDIKGGTADFFYGTAADQWTALAKGADVTILSTRKAGGFVGTVIGPYAYSPQ